MNAIIVFTALLALGLRAHTLAGSGLLSVTQYDDGPYFGSAVRLVHGVLPYRSFAFVQPPGIALLMSPAAVLSYLTGTAAALVAGRMLTVLAGTASVLLGGLLVRHRGPVVVLVTCGILAIYPPAVAAAHTVLLEPWLVLCCLIGALAVFDGDQLADGWRLAWGGAAFGAGGAVKAWAIAPVLVIVVLCLPGLRRAATFAAGVAAGFMVPVLPFAVAAPGPFYNSVVVAQLGRIGRRTPAWKRAHAMLGLPPAVVVSHSALLWMAAGILGASILLQAAAWLLTRQVPAVLDWFALTTAILVAGMFLWPPYFASHYCAFIAPFLALALALPLPRLLGRIRLVPGHPAGRSLAWAAMGLAGAALLVAGILQVLPRAGARVKPPLSVTISRVIPAGACVLTDQSTYLLLSNRFLASMPDCSQMVDSLGTDLALSGGRRPSTGAAAVPAVRASWRKAFSTAQYLLLTAKNGLRVPWTPRLRAYLHQDFRPVLRTPNFVVYARRGLPRLWTGYHASAPAVGNAHGHANRLGPSPYMYNRAHPHTSPNPQGTAEDGRARSPALHAEPCLSQAQLGRSCRQTGLICVMTGSLLILIGWPGPVRAGCGEGPCHTVLWGSRRRTRPAGSACTAPPARRPTP